MLDPGSRWTHFSTTLHSALRVFQLYVPRHQSELPQEAHRRNQPMSHLGKTPEGYLSTSFASFSVMNKKDRIRHQLSSCAEQMQGLLDQLNPTHRISRSLETSITRIQCFNEIDRPGVLSLWQDLLHTPRTLPFRAGEFSRQVEPQSLFDRRVDRTPDIPILIVDANNYREEGLPEVKKKSKARNAVDELFDAATKWKVMRKRKNADDDELIQPGNELEEVLSGMEKKVKVRNVIGKIHDPTIKWKVIRKPKNDDYDGDDELNQHDAKRPKRSKKQEYIPF